MAPPTSSLIPPHIFPPHSLIFVGRDPLLQLLSHGNDCFPRHPLEGAGREAEALLLLLALSVFVASFQRRGGQGESARVVGGAAKGSQTGGGPALATQRPDPGPPTLPACRARRGLLVPDVLRGCPLLRLGGAR